MDIEEIKEIIHYTIGEIFITMALYMALKSVCRVLFGEVKYIILKDK